MNDGWHEIIEGTVNYYQITYNTSTIVAQLLECNNILNKQIIAKSVNSDNIFLPQSKIRIAAKAHFPEDSSEQCNNDCIRRKNKVCKQAEVENINLGAK